MKRIFTVFLLTLATFILFIGPASAAQKHKADLPTEGIMSSDPNCGTSESQPDTQDQVSATSGLISNCGTTIANLGGGNVSIYGYTQTYTTVSSIKVTVYLQKWTGSTWVDLVGTSNSASYASYISASKTFAVSPGYYYRTKAIHTATSGYTETITDYSSYIYI